MNKGLLIKLSKLILELKEIATDKGILTYEDVLDVNSEVYILEGEEYVAAPSGEYESETSIIVVVDGLVTEIRAKEEATPVEEPVADPVELDERDERIAALEAEIASRDEIIAARDAEIEALKARIAELESESVALSAAEEAKKQSKIKAKSDFYSGLIK